MSSESDVEMKSALPKKITKKIPKSPSDEILKNNQETKKSTTTKDMVKDALTELNTRKGVSLYAVKKFITEKYDVNPDKIKYFIKKAIKSEIEKGFIIQTKGIGASGSFKLAPKKKEEKKKNTEKKSIKEKSDKPKATKKEMVKTKTKKDENKPTKDKAESKKSKPKNKKEKIAKEPKADKKKVEKIATEKQTPAKKRSAMMKRKSIGSIIKPPKMKPKAR